MTGTALSVSQAPFHKAPIPPSLACDQYEATRNGILHIDGAVGATFVEFIGLGLAALTAVVTGRKRSAMAVAALTQFLAVAFGLHAGRASAISDRLEKGVWCVREGGIRCTSEKGALEQRCNRIVLEYLGQQNAGASRPAPKGVGGAFCEFHRTLGQHLPRNETISVTAWNPSVCPPVDPDDGFPYFCPDRWGYWRSDRSLGSLVKAFGCESLNGGNN